MLRHRWSRTYLGVQITHKSRRLSSDQIQGILQLPSPMTRKQLRAFLGLTGYCRIWIPNYGLIAQPLYESLKRQYDSIPLMWGTQKKAEVTLSSVQLRHSVVSHSLPLHELQHARPPCPSPTPGVHSDSCPSSQ